MKLLVLRCPQCAQPVQPDTDDAVVMSCRNCFTAVSISDSGLQEMSVQFAAPTAEAGISDWLPFWIFKAQVNLQDRQTQGGNRKDREVAAHFWATSRQLYVPAWELPVRQAREIGGDLVKRQTQFQPIDPPAEAVLKTAVVTATDALKLLEFVVLTLEAQRSDWLKSIRFEIDAKPPTLWALPAHHQGGYNWQILAQETQT